MDWFILFGCVFFYFSGMWVVSYAWGRWTKEDSYEIAGPLLVVFWPVVPIAAVFVAPYALLMHAHSLGRKRKRLRKV